STARRRSAFIGKVRTSPWPGAPGFQRRSIPPIEAGTTSPRPVPHSTSVSCARATSSWRDTPEPRASFIASAVLRAAAALTPNPWDTGSGVSLKILISMGRGPTIFSTTRRVTSAGRRRSFTRMSIAGREASRSFATVWTPRLNERPAPREPFARGFGFSRSEEHTSELQSRVELVCRLLPRVLSFPTRRSSDLDFHGARADHFFDDAPGDLGRPTSLVHEDVNRRPRGVSFLRNCLDAKAQ